MDNDLLMVTGVIIFALTFPVAVSSFAHGRPPRTAALTILLGGGLMVYAHLSRPGGYTFDEVPQLFVQVFGRLIS